MAGRLCDVIQSCVVCMIERAKTEEYFVCREQSQRYQATVQYSAKRSSQRIQTRTRGGPFGEYLPGRCLDRERQTFVEGRRLISLSCIVDPCRRFKDYSLGAGTTLMRRAVVQRQGAQGANSCEVNHGEWTVLWRKWQV